MDFFAFTFLPVCLLSREIAVVMRNRRIKNNAKDEDDLIVIEENTTYFSASSAWAQYSDGLEHNFLPPAKADPRQTIEFGDGAIGYYLDFFFNFTNGEDEIQRGRFGDRLKHSVAIVLELLPKGLESDYDWQWRIAQAWTTSKWQWEWLGLGWKERGFATLPRGDWDALRCDSMEFYIGHRLILTNVTLGAYLPIGFNSDDLRVYSPCGQRTCHIINNGVYCRGFGSSGPFIVLLIFPLCVIGCVLYTVHKRWLSKLYRNIIRRGVAEVDSEIMEMARLREEACESNRSTESVVKDPIQIDAYVDEDVLSKETNGTV